MSIADDIAKLESAIRKGVKLVRYDTHTVEYQSRADMQATLSDMKREQASTGGTTPPTRTVYATDRGFR